MKLMHTKHYYAGTQRIVSCIGAESIDDFAGEAIDRQVSIAAPKLFFYRPDHLGIPTWMTDANGIPYQFFLNLPFGESMAEQHSLTEDFETPYKFNGKELDTETGYYYYGARYYDPKISIWLSLDPLMAKYPNVNPYVYCLQNPIMLIDPTGMSAENSDGGGIGEWFKKNI